MKEEHSILGFYKLTLPLRNDLFSELSESFDYEDVTKGRKGNHLVNVEEKGIPIVRTTSKYNKPANTFSDLHSLIEDSIKNEATKLMKIQDSSVSFNNALIEIYDKSYTKMKYHSDQCLDLENDSYIALFSCYEHPDHLSENFIRKLKIKSKTTNEEFEFSLDNNSVILFKMSTNAHFQHKIILDTVSKKKQSDTDNRWLGITLRKSKTFINFKNDLPYFKNGEQLTIADEAQQSQFYKLRGQENRSMDFEYPEISYTLSLSDTMMPKKH